MKKIVCVAGSLAIVGCNLVAGLGDFKDAPSGTGGQTTGTGGAGASGGGGTGGALAGCGDGVMAGGEVCDGADLGSAACTSAGEFYDGELACNGDCKGFDTSGCFGPPSVPQPHTPMNNSYVGSIFASGSRRPVFSWLPSSLPEGAPLGPTIRYELELDADGPDFANPEVIDAQAQTSYQPPVDLDFSLDPPVGARYWWRVRACIDTVCSAYSSPWYVNVGRARNDFDGDGYSDVLVGANKENGLLGRAYLYRGGPNFGTSASEMVDGEMADPDGNPADGGFGRALTVGDFNGDGFADAVIDAWRYNKGTAYVYFGGPNGLFGDAPVTLTIACCELGSALGTMSDVNGDGRDDLVLGAIYAAGAFVYFGRADKTFPDGQMPDVVIEQPPDAVPIAGSPSIWFGIQAATAGDVNGDGKADVLIGASHEPTGKAYLYLGGDTVSSEPAAVLTNDVMGGWFGIAGGAAGDVNGDGYGDLVVGSIWANEAYVYMGGPGVFDTTPDGTLAAPSGGGFGEDVAGAGDVDRDGYDDVIVGARNGEANAGGAYVYLGGPGGTFKGMVAALFAGTVSGEQAGIVAAAGDVDGDGFADMLVGAPHDSGSTGGKVRVFLGAPQLSTMPAAELDPAGAMSDGFGFSCK